MYDRKQKHRRSGVGCAGHQTTGRPHHRIGKREGALKSLQQRIAFRYVSGLSDRVIYRELFPKGLTLVDLKDIDDGPKMTMSHVAARYELRKLMDQLSLPGWNR